MAIETQWMIAFAVCVVVIAVLWKLNVSFRRMYHKNKAVLAEMREERFLRRDEVRKIRQERADILKQQHSGVSRAVFSEVPERNEEFVGRPIEIDDLITL